MQTKTIFFIGALLFCVAMVRAVYLGPYQYDGCVDINSSGQFTLGSDLVGANVTPPTLLTTACILISEPNVELDCYNHTITNNVAGNTTGILLESRNSTPLTNITVKNCVVSNYTWDIYVYNSTDSTVLNNNATLAVNIGFTIHNSSSINLTNNTAYGNPGDGFSVVNSLYNILDNNTAHNNTNGFVSKDASAYNTFTNNLAYNVSTGFYLNYTYNNTFSGDTARNNTWGFIILGNSSGNNLTSSTAYGSFWHGFLMQSVSGSNLLMNNTAYSNSYEGFYVAGSNLTTLINNTAYDNHEDGFLVGNSSSYIVLTNNTAYSNIINGFEVGSSTYNTLDNNTAYNNTRSGFALYYADYNNLTNNHYNQPLYQDGYLRYDAFEVYNSSYNNLVNNTALNGYEAGFGIYGSNYNSFVNNTAINNSWEGFVISSSFNNSFIDNLAYGSQQYGFEIFISSGNNLTNNTAQENEMFDFYTDALSWNFFLNATLADNEFCNNLIQNLTGSGGRPINYSNTSVNWDGITASEIVLCNADGSNITNSIVHGSDIIRNNGIILTSTDGVVMDNVTSSDNFVGFAALLSNNNNFTNNIAEDDLLAGFANFVGVGNRFASNIQSGSIQGGFLELFSNDSVYINNTAHGNYFTGFAITEGSNNTRLTNNTVYNTTEIGVMVGSSDFTMITGDHYYDNDVDFAVNTTILLGPLNLSGVIFDNPLGNYEHYTNLSLNDDVQPGEFYSITWSTKPAPDPGWDLAFEDKFINIQATPGASINNVIWHWTDAEATGRNDNYFKIMRYGGSGWTTPPGLSMLNPTENYISITNLNGFGVFGIYETGSLPFSPGTGGGESCTNSLKISLVKTICPGNKAVLQVSKSDGTPVGAGDMVTLTVDTWKYVEHTDSSGQVTFTLPRSSSYSVHAVSGFYCGDYTLNYTLCSAVSTGCTSDSDCADTQYCDSSGACRTVGCPCGQSYEHSCHPYACCADSDCNSSYACVDHQCKLVTKPECTTNDDCKYNEYCGDGKCLPVQVGTCGRISNHAWKDYDCCNDSDCQNGMVCKDNACTQVYTITTNPTGPVGESHQIKVLPEGKYTLNVVTPKGETKTVETDQSGNAVFMLDNAGTYTVYLLKDEATKASVAVDAVNKTPADVNRPSPQQDFTFILLLAGAGVIIIILLVLYMLSRRGRRRY